MSKQAKQEVLTDLSRVPKELRGRPQWVGWCLEESGRTKTKVPYDPKIGRRAKTNDLLTWGTWEVANKAFELGDYDGVGFVFCSGDPFVGIDLDRCRNQDTGEIEPWADEIIQALDGYAEVSPSGAGVHVIVRGKAPNRRRGSVEVYSTERFFTVTGRAL